VDKAELVENSISDIFKKLGMQKEDDDYDKYYAN